MKKARPITRALPWVLVFLAIQISLVLVKAQKTARGNQSTGSVSGIVRDPSGAIFEGATVTLKSNQSDVIRTAATNSDGVYRFDGVPPGKYTVTISAQNFSTYVADNVLVKPRGTAIVNTVLEIGGGGVMTMTVESSRAEGSHNLEVFSVTFSPNGLNVLTGHDGSVAILWNASTGAEIRRLKQGDSIRSVSISPDGSYFLLAGDKVRLVDAKTGRTTRSFEGHLETVFSAVFSPDGRSILTAGKDGIVRLWDINTGKLIRKFEGHINEIRAAVFSPDGRYIATAEGDRIARLWDVAKGSEIRMFGSSADDETEYTSIAFSPNGRFVLTGSDEKTAKLWDAATGKEIRKFIGHSDTVNSVAFSPDGRYVLTGSGSDHDAGETGDYTVRLWDSSTGKEIRKFVGHEKMVRSVAFSPDGRFVVTGSEDRTVRLWSAATGKEIRKF